MNEPHSIRIDGLALRRATTERISNLWRRSKARGPSLWYESRPVRWCRMHKGTAEVSDDFCATPCGPVWAASTPVVRPQTRHGSILIHARYLALRVGFMLGHALLAPHRPCGVRRVLEIWVVIGD